MRAWKVLGCLALSLALAGVDCDGGSVDTADPHYQRRHRRIRRWTGWFLLLCADALISDPSATLSIAAAGVDAPRTTLGASRILDLALDQSWG